MTETTCEENISGILSSVLFKVDFCHPLNSLKLVAGCRRKAKLFRCGIKNSGVTSIRISASVHPRSKYKTSIQRRREVSDPGTQIPGCRPNVRAVICSGWLFAIHVDHEKGILYRTSVESCQMPIYPRSPKSSIMIARSS